MVSIPNKVRDRLVAGIKKFQPVIATQKAADIAEANTVILVQELLSEVFGYEKIGEISAEYEIKGHRCDLATVVDDKLQTLIEVKAIGHTLKDINVSQAVNYVANHGGVGWAVLTNAQHWRAYCVKCEGKVDEELVLDIDFLTLNHRSDDDLELLFLLCKEGWAKSAIDDYQDQKKPLDRFIVGAMILSDAVLDVIKRELRRVSPKARLEADDIREVLQEQVLKRELLEGPKAEAAKATVKKAGKVVLRETAAG